MARTVFVALLCAGGLFAAPSFSPLRATDPPGEDFNNRLVIQTTILRAQEYLNRSDAAKAVDLLESQLPRINGHRNFLMKLRDAYRDHVKNLYLSSQDELAEKYRKRLAILDPDAAEKLKPAAPVRAVALEKMPAPEPQAPVLAELAETAPRWKPALPSGLFPKRRNPPATAEKMAIARAKDLDEDPFDQQNEIKLALAPVPAPEADGRQQRIKALVARAESEYVGKHFAEAKRLFDEAHQADPALLGECRERWAFCILFHAVEQLKRPEVPPQSLALLEGEVRSAMSMAPAVPDLVKQGEKLLGVIHGLRSSPAGIQPATAAVKHFERNQAGWQLAETANFRIFHTQSRDYAEQIAQIVERVRAQAHRKWFGADPPSWSPKCDVIIHATAEEYQKATGVSRDSPGHASIGLDQTTGRVATRRIDFPHGNPALLTDVLPHEATHAVIAGNFGRFEVPRWADEGMAVLGETEGRIDAHRLNLARVMRENRLLPLREVMTMKNYPHPSQIIAFYAQSTSLVEYLTRLAGPVTFARFVREGLEGGGYEAALRKHYNIRDFNELQERWSRQMQVELASR